MSTTVCGPPRTPVIQAAHLQALSRDGRCINEAVLGGISSQVPATRQRRLKKKKKKKKKLRETKRTQTSTMLFWMIVILCVTASSAVPPVVIVQNPTNCSVPCGCGYQVLANGSVALCNVQPCPDECDKCELTNGVGYLPSKFDCNCFYQCIPVKAGENDKFSWKVVKQCCANCLHWDPDVCACDYACCKKCTTGAFACINPGATIPVEVFTTDQDFSLLPPYTITCEYVCVSAGSYWTVTDGGSGTSDLYCGYQTGLFTISKLEKHYIDTCDDWSNWSNWGECYPSCDKYGNASAEGQRRSRRGKHVVNWCDRPCPCDERNETCNSTDFVCPTMFTRDPCPVFFWLQFINNYEDKFGSAVLQPFGVLGFDDVSWAFCGNEEPANVVSANFNDDMLQVPVFNNWFSEPNNQKFALSVWVYNGTQGTIFQNGCTGSPGGAASVHISVAGNVGTAVLQVENPDHECRCTADLADSSRVNNPGWKFFVVFFDGNNLVCCGGANCNENVEPCQGEIINNKCDVTIGADNGGNNYVGLMDELKVYTMGVPPINLHDCCPCP